MNALMPALAVTVGPVLVLAPVVYALRPQGGTRWLSLRPRPAREVIARLAAETKAGLIPAGPFGDTSRPPTWTVLADDIVWTSTADRDLTGAFPVAAVA